MAPRPSLRSCCLTCCRRSGWSRLAESNRGQPHYEAGLARHDCAASLDFRKLLFCSRKLLFTAASRTAAVARLGVERQEQHCLRLISQRLGAGATAATGSTTPRPRPARRRSVRFTRRCSPSYRPVPGPRGADGGAAAAHRRRRRGRPEPDRAQRQGPAQYAHGKPSAYTADRCRPGSAVDGHMRPLAGKKVQVSALGGV
jgi:hypothetical protein